MMRAQEIHNWRTSRSLTHDQLAGLIGRTARSVYRYEAGEVKVPHAVTLALELLGAKLKNGEIDPAKIPKPPQYKRKKKAKKKAKRGKAA